MTWRRSKPNRKRIFGALAMAAALVLFGAAFFPTLYRDDTFEITAGPLPAAYTLAVHYPSFGQADAGAEVTAVLRPEETGDGKVAGVVAAEVQSVDARFSPSGRILAPLPAGRPVRFSWQVSGTTSGERPFSLFLLVQSADTAPDDLTALPFWAHDFSWVTFSGLGEARVPVVICAVFLFLAGFGTLLVSRPRKPAAR